MDVGRRVTELSGAATWMLGDYLAYGQKNFNKSHWGDRDPSELYAKLSLATGLSEQTLRNAACVCKKLPLSRRRDNVSFSHVVEIVGRVKDEADHDGWIDWVSQGGVTVRALRERIRGEGATVRPEIGDTGANSFLEKSRQYARDFAAQSASMSPGMIVELRKILAPVVRGLS